MLSLCTNQSLILTILLRRATPSSAARFLQNHYQERTNVFHHRKINFWKDIVIGLIHQFLFHRNALWNTIPNMKSKLARLQHILFLIDSHFIQKTSRWVDFPHSQLPICWSQYCGTKYCYKQNDYSLSSNIFAK